MDYATVGFCSTLIFFRGSTMKCPSCGNTQNSTLECERCGIIFKKYRARQQRLAEEKLAKETQSAKKKKSLSSLAIGLIVGLLVGGGAFFYFGKGSDPVTPSVDIAGAPTEQQTASEKFQNNADTGQKTTSRAPRQQNRNSSLEGLAAQLHESHPATTAIEKARNATVFIKTSWGSGTGFFVSGNGLIVTNKHVLQMQEKDIKALNDNAEKGAKLLAGEKKRIEYLKSQVSRIADEGMRRQLKEDIRTREQEYAKYSALHQQLLEQISTIETASPTDDVEVVLIDGSTWPVSSVTISERHDLALISIDAYASPYLSTSRSPRDQGQKVYTVGNPHGLRHTVTSGVISGYRNYNGEFYIQTDAPINPGNSGGPLVDEAGKVLGVNTMIIRDTEGIGFAIPMKSVFEEFGNYISVK